MPERIQRKRTAGWRMPPNTVYVGRPTTWGNPLVVGHRYEEGDSFLKHYGYLLDGGLVTAENCLKAFEAYCAAHLRYDTEWIDFLRGKDLACWCPLDSPCHADVLLRLANQTAEAAAMTDWVKAASRLPEAVHGYEGKEDSPFLSDDVLVFFDGGMVDVANYDHEDGKWSLVNHGFKEPDCDPSFWMPLPEFPAA